MKKKFQDILERMNPIERRDFLKVLSIALAASNVPKWMGQASNDIFFDNAEAQSALTNKPTNFIEFNLRDQWDTSHMFVPPGVATSSRYNQRISTSGGRRLSVYENQDKLIKASGNYYLTEESRSLMPHLENLATLELCELPIGTIHGHEASNATRSPGRSKANGNGRYQMYGKDNATKEGGNEYHYSSSPTPGMLHNYYRRKIDSNYRKNMVAFKGISRSIHTVYHFDGGLSGVGIDRILNRQSLLNKFSNQQVQTTLPFRAEHASLVTKFLKGLDARFFQRYGYMGTINDQHLAKLNDVEGKLSANNQNANVNFNLALTAEERAYWSAGVPSSNGYRSENGRNSIPIWEQCAYATKLIASGVVNTFAIEHDLVDIHGIRNEKAVKTMGSQASLCLSRMIETLKKAGVYDQTLIAAYTTDGSRPMHIDSFGNNGKNTVSLAGGMVKGGYYGDIKLSESTGYTYHRPDENTGNAINNGTTGNGSRTSGALIYNTVAKALGIPVEQNDYQFPDTDNGKYLKFMV